MARNKVEDPITVQDSSGSKTTHPAYGQISASRVSSNPGANLYGSDFKHANYVSIRIYESELNRSLNYDSNYANKELVEVCLSESQWATFVSSMNRGGGPCCTISHINGESRPSLPSPIDRTHQFDQEMRAKLKTTIDSVNDAINELKLSGLSAKKASVITSKLDAIKRELNSNVPFVAEQFAEAMEDTVEKAKQEIHGYINNTLNRAGLEHMKSNTVLSLQYREEDND